jgi:hypothetical protein
MGALEVPGFVCGLICAICAPLGLWLAWWLDRRREPAIRSRLDSFRNNNSESGAGDFELQDFTRAGRANRDIVAAPEPTYQSRSVDSESIEIP